MSLGLILIVEDNEKNMKLFRDVLQATGYATLEARTGEEAIELAVSGIAGAGVDGRAAARASTASKRSRCCEPTSEPPRSRWSR